MAAISRKTMEVFTSLFFVASLIASGLGDRVKKKIYIDLDTQSSCFRILNSTHEVGCTSSMKGNVGTVHYVQDESDMDWILSKGPHEPYAALLDAVNFTGPIVTRLYKSSRVNGILVINSINDSSLMPQWPEEGFSPLDQCPNDAYGLYENSSDYQKCQKGNWNVPGTSLGRVNLNIPVFALSTEKDIDNVKNKCFYPFNFNAKEKSTGYPVCAVEMKARMDAAVNSVTCMRRSDILALSLSPQSDFCDPLGDKNVMATMLDKNDTVPRENNSVIVVASKLDSTALFMNEYHAADTTVAAMVTLLASAEALWKVKDAIRNESNAKDIMYTFFQGETFDYIGSSRMVYDMREDTFPPAPDNPHKSYQYLQQMDLSHIGQIVEMNQVGQRDEGSVWAHTDPLGQAAVGKQVQQMIEDLKSFGKDMNVSLEEANKALPLPPASAQSFLKHRLDIPTMVVTDHRKEYTNKFYNSRFDLARFIDANNYPENSTDQEKYDFVTAQADRISNLATSLARYLYKASTGKEPDDEMKKTLTASNSTVTHLLYCFMVSPNCELFIESVEKSNEKSLKTAKAPFPFYVSVVGLHVNEVTQLVYTLLARFTGEKMDLKKADCNAPKKEKRFSYIWMQGAKVPGPKGDEREGWCIKSTAFYSLAKSPAFDIDGYDMSSNEYSTWTESVWGGQAIRVRLFLIPSPELQRSVLITGLFMFVVSMLVVYFLYAKGDILFSQHNPGSSPHYTSYCTM